MSYLYAFLRDLSGLPAYRRQLILAGKAWREQLVIYDYAPAYRATGGWSRRRRVLRLLPPNGATQLKGWCIYLHGGAWTFGKPDDFVAAAQPWLDQGYGVLLPTYRRMPRYRCSDMLEDLQLLLTFAQQSDWVKESHSSPFIAGMSSGGHLAALLALSPNIWTSAGWKTPAAAICCGAPLDLNLLPNNFYLNRLRGEKREGDYQKSNPHELLLSTPQPPPFLLIHPTQDGMAPAQQAAAFYSTLEAKSPASKMVWLKDKGHLAAGRWMFDTDDPVRIEISNFIKRSQISL